MTNPKFAYPSSVLKGKVGLISRLNINLRTLLHELFQPLYLSKEDESHGGEDVIIYAKGPWSHLFQSQHEETYVAYAISYAACIGPLVEMNKFCSGGDQIGVQENKQVSKEQTAVFVSGIRFLPSIWFFLFVGILLVVFYCTTSGSRKRQHEDYNVV